VLLSDRVQLPAVVCGGAPSADDLPERPLSGVLARLDEACTTMAKLLDDAPSADLLRTGVAPDGSDITALDVARQGVRLGADNLLVVQRALDAED
jgi:hypothetical protein